jgi:phage-related protein
MAKGPGTKNTVGKVGVAVVPDTRNFARDLKAKLEEIEKRASIGVPLDLDAKDAMRQFRQLKAQIEAQNVDIRANVKASGLSSVTKTLSQVASPRSTQSMNGLVASLRKAGDNAERLAQALVRVRQHAAINASLALQLAVRTLRAALSADRARNAWQGLSLAVSAVGDAVRKIPELASMARHLAAIGRSSAALAVDKVAAFGKAAGQSSTYTDLWRKAMVGVNRLTIEANGALEGVGRRIKNISFRSIINGARNAGSALLRMGRSAGTVAGLGFDKTVLAIGGAIRAGFRGVAGLVRGVGSAFSGAADALIHMGKTGALLAVILAVIAPLLGLISGLIAGIPSLVLAFGGAIAAVALGMDGIKKAAKVLADDVDRLKKALSDTFSKGLAPVFKQLEKVFPVLQRGLVQVAQGLIPLAGAFTQVVTSAGGMTQISNILKNTGKFFADLAPTVKDFTRSFITIAEAGSSQFHVLSDVLNTFAANWETMISRVASNGTLAEAIQGLGQVTSALLDLFTRVFEAGLTSMSKLGQPLANFIDGFTDLFVSLAPILNGLSDRVFTVLGGAMRAVATVITELTPVVQEISRLLGDVLGGAAKALIPVIGPLATILSTVLGTALRAIQPILPPLIGFLIQLGNIIGVALTNAMAALAPLLVEIGIFFGQILAALVPILPAILSLVQEGLTALTQVLSALIPPLLQVAQAVFPLLVQVIRDAIPVVAGVINAFLPFIPMIADIVAAIGQTMIPVMQAILGVIQTVWPAIQTIITSALRVVEGALKAALAVIRGDWRGAWDGIKQILSASWDAIKASVSGGIAGVTALFRDLPGRILGALGDLGGLLWNAGKSIIGGLLRGLKSAVGEVYSFVSGIAGKIASLKGPIPKDRRLLIPAGLAIMEGLRNGLGDGFRDVESTVSRMAGAIESQFNGMDLSARVGVRGAYDAAGSIQQNSRDALIAEAIEKGLAAMGIQFDSRGVATVVKRGASLNYTR